jgi:hypothetical protein
MTCESLGEIVEFSIGLAGFSAVVTAFLHRSRSLTPIDQFRTINLLLLSLTPAFLAFLFTGMASMSEDMVFVAKFSSVVFAVWLACMLVFIYRAKRRLPPEHEAALSSGIFVGMYAVGTSMVVVLGASAIFAQKYAFSTFYFGLVVMLLFAVVQFIRILIGVRVEDDA